MKSLKNDKENVFPCLKISVLTGTIVLFISRDTGIVVNTNDMSYDFEDIGHMYRDIDETKFVNYSGEVILSN